MADRLMPREVYTIPAGKLTHLIKEQADSDDSPVVFITSGGGIWQLDYIERDERNGTVVIQIRSS